MVRARIQRLALALLVPFFLVSLVGCPAMHKDQGKMARGPWRPEAPPDRAFRVEGKTEEKKTTEKKSDGEKADKEHNTEAYAHIRDNDFLHTVRAPLSTFSIDVDTASYSNVRRFLTQEKR